MTKHLISRPLLSLVATYCILNFTACAFSAKTSQRYFSKAEKKQYDVIIVPGMPFENGSWGRILKGRIYWSKYLYDKGIAKNIIYSGAAVYSPYYEGKIMAEYAVALGIPAEHVFTEDHAEHSTENVYYSYKLAKKLGFTKIALASDPFQTKQLRKFIRKKVDPSVDIIPFVTDTLKQIEPSMIDPVIDYQKCFKKDFVPLAKREGPLKRWRGTRGKNIDTTLYN